MMNQKECLLRKVALIYETSKQTSVYRNLHQTVFALKLRIALNTFFALASEKNTSNTLDLMRFRKLKKTFGHFYLKTMKEN